MTTADDGVLAQHPRVLVVEPDFLVRDFLVTTLSAVGLLVVQGADAADARLELQTGRIDLAFVEVMLRDVRGDVLAAEITAQGGAVVLMSGHPDGVRRAQASGCDLLTKPIHHKDVLRMAVLKLPTWHVP